MNLLSIRQQSILNRVVDTHIETGQPVGSKHITEIYTEMYQNTYSSATVRQEMLRLEEKGYLTHPHTSAGRIPTDQGYRYYVDHGIQLERPELETLNQLQDGLLASMEKLATFADQVSLILSRLSGQLSLMMVPDRLEKEKNPSYQIAIRGANRISAQQEFLDRNKLSLLLEGLENRYELADWLKSRSENPGTTVSIGRENQSEAFRECAVISSRVYYRGEVMGVLALLGPRRMRYSKAVPLVSEMAQTVGCILERNFSNE